MNSEKLDLWIDRKSSHVSVDNGQLVWRVNNKQQDRIPMTYLSSVTFWGNTTIESRLLCALANQGISVNFMTMSQKGNGTALAQSMQGPSSNRLVQYHLQHNKSAQLEIAKNIVLGKLINYEKVAKEFYKIDFGDLCFGQRFEKDIESVENHAKLMGIEGAASRIWFQRLGRIISDKWGFSGRNYYPARDPVNALLSLGYTLTEQPLRQAFMALGLDLNLGCLHQPYSGRESLICDAVEWLRPYVDCFTVTVLEALNPTDFSTVKNGACRMSKEGRKKYYQGWWQHYDTWECFLPDVVTNEVQSLPKQCWALARYFKQQYFSGNLVN